MRAWIIAGTAWALAGWIWASRLDAGAPLSSGTWNLLAAYVVAGIVVLFGLGRALLRRPAQPSTGSGATSASPSSPEQPLHAPPAALPSEPEPATTPPSRDWTRPLLAFAVCTMLALAEVALLLLPPPAEDPAVVLRAMPYYERLWGFQQLALRGGDLTLRPTQASHLLSIMRQGPMQSDGEAMRVFLEAYNRVLTPSRSIWVSEQGAGLARLVAAMKPEDARTAPTIPPGVLLGVALEQLSARAEEDWKGVPLPDRLVGTLSLPMDTRPVNGLLAQVALLAAAPPPQGLTKEEARALLPTVTCLVDAADASSQHASAMADLLDNRQARWVVDEWRAAHRKVTEPDSRAVPPFAGCGEVFTWYASRFQLLDGEPATIEPQDRTSLIVPYNDLLWGVLMLAQGGPGSLTRQQTEEIVGIVRRVVVWSRGVKPLYASVLEATRRALRPDQWAYVLSHPTNPEIFATRLQQRTPAGADVIGYALMQLLEQRGSAHAFALPTAKMLDSSGQSLPPNPGSCFAAILMMDETPSLRLDAAQARALLPYVRLAAHSNDMNHLVKERIGDILSEQQRVAIMKGLQARGPATRMVEPPEVVTALEARLARQRD